MKNQNNTFHSIPLTKLTASISKALNIFAPKQADSALDGMNSFIDGSGQGKIDRVLLFHPSGIGADFLNNNYDKFQSIKDKIPYRIPFLAEHPPIPATSLTTMYTGVHNNCHGITNNRKTTLITDTIFDTLDKAGKKSAIVTIKNSALYKIFINSAANVFTERYDAEVVSKAAELIKNNEYDFIAVYNQEYDDAIHLSHPNSKIAKKAFKHYITAFDLLSDAAKVFWKDSNTLIGFAPDHGAHKAWYGLGTYGKYSAEDMNIVHYYGIIQKQ